MVQILGPYDQGDFRTMQMLRANIKFYQTKDPVTYGDVVVKHRSNLKEYFRKVA